MAKLTIDRGTGAGNGDGEVLYDAFGKVNANFTELYDFDASLALQGGAALIGNTPVTGIAATTVQGAINELNTEKAPLASPTFTGTVSGVTKAMVGLTNVEDKSSATIRSEIQAGDIPDLSGTYGDAYYATLAATTTGNGATLIGVEAGSGFTATDVQAALEEVRTANGGGDATYATLAATTNGDGAALIGIEDSAGDFTATTVEGALAELESEKAASADLAAVTNGNGAALIGIEPGTFTATDVQGALEELAVESDAYPDGAQSSVASAAFTMTGAARSALPAEASMRVHATADCWIAFGDDTVTVDGTSGIFFARGTEMIKAPAAATHVAVRGELSIGALNLTGVTSVLGYELGNTVQLAYSAVTDNVALPTNNGYIRVYAPTDCYIVFGTSSAVTASTTTGTYFEAGTEVLKVPTSATHLAMVQYSIAASAYITGMTI